MSNSKAKKAPPKERGFWLSALLIVIVIHSAFATVLILDLQSRQHVARYPWAMPSLLLLSLADIVAVIAIWNWKKWGLVLYIVSVAAGIAVGLVLTRSQLIVFHDVVPLLLLGYLIRDQHNLFD